jgi:hypothetical protein
MSEFEPVAWAKPFDLKVLDTQGKALTRLYRREKKTAKATVALFTAAQMREAEQQALDKLLKRAWTNQPYEVYSAIRALMQTAHTGQEKT